MNKKSDKRLCWNCEGDVSLHLTQCPFCGVNVTTPAPETENRPYKGMGSPFQSASPDIPKPPYANLFSNDFSISEEEWNKALDEEKKEKVPEQENPSPVHKKEMIAFLLLLPGIVFCFFGLALLLFSHEGILTLRWKQNLAYFYFLGAFPLLYLGWRALK